MGGGEGRGEEKSALHYFTIAQVFLIFKLNFNNMQAKLSFNAGYIICNIFPTFMLSLVYTEGGEGGEKRKVTSRHSPDSK